MRLPKQVPFSSWPLVTCGCGVLQIKAWVLEQKKHLEGTICDNKLVKRKQQEHLEGTICDNKLVNGKQQEHLEGTICDKQPVKGKQQEHLGYDL